jgi:hypothetical protein
MNIIFKTHAPNIDEKYIVLDLDTFSLPDGSVHTACCVVENIPIAELPLTQSLKELHTNLIDNYGQRNWNYCEQAIEHLMGKWGGELDSFYDELSTRIQQYQQEEPGPDWTPIIIKT